MRMFSFLLTVMAFCLWVVGYMYAAWSVDGSLEDQIQATNVWMLNDALAKVMMVSAFALMVKGAFREWLWFIAAVAVNSLLDELFFDPLALGVNEWLISILLSVYYTFKITHAHVASCKLG